MSKTLPQKFFNRPTLKIAKDLLGKFLVRKIGNKKIYLIITEVEAYDGFKDKASHASRGKTERNKIMFEKGGCFYVYFTYGMHHMLNIVTCEKHYPAAILIRAGIIINQSNLKNTDISRYISRNKTILKSKNFSSPLSPLNFINFSLHKQISGPAKLTKFLKIDKKFNNIKATIKNNLWFEDYGIKINLSQIIAKKRAGVEYAGKFWANKKWNFSINH